MRTKPLELEISSLPPFSSGRVHTPFSGRRHGGPGAFPAPPCRRRLNGYSTPAAFTLVEVMIVLMVVAVMTAFCIPSYQRALEQSRANVAGANLRAIWAAQRLYWLEYHTYAGDANDIAKGITDLGGMGVLDLRSMGSAGGYEYYIQIDPPPTAETFKAAARRTDINNFWNGTLTIDRTGLIEGEITAGDGTVITPGSQ